MSAWQERTLASEDTSRRPGTLEVGARDSLTRVLAREGRNALARVELVTSELDRFESPPSVRERLATIREAVEEIDSLFAKIDLLSGEGGAAADIGTSVARVWSEVSRRMGPVLRARRCGLDVDTIDPELRADVTEPALEAILLAYLRLALQIHPAAETLALRVEPLTSCLRLVFEPEMDPQASPAPPDPGSGTGNAVELELLVVEVGGILEPGLDEGGDGSLPALLLPLEASA